MLKRDKDNLVALNNLAGSFIVEWNVQMAGALLAAVPTLFVAALCTVWLVFSSRRATLNQINHSLAEISDQLRQMRSDPRTARSG